MAERGGSDGEDSVIAQCAACGSLFRTAAAAEAHFKFGVCRESQAARRAMEALETSGPMPIDRDRKRKPRQKQPEREERRR